MSLIRGLTGSHHFSIANGSPTSTYYNNNGSPMTGMVRYYNNNFEVYDGSIWNTIQGAYATVSLTGSASSAIDWAIKKMGEEAELEEMSEEHPAVKAAYENMKRAAEQLKTTIILSKDEQSTT